MVVPLTIRLLYLFLHFYQPFAQAMVVPRAPVPVASMARLKVVARGAASLGTLEARIAEFSYALAGVLGRRCSDEDGCLTVTVEWQPLESPSDDASLQMSLSLVKDQKANGKE